LIERIRAVLRRSEATAQPGDGIGDELMIRGELRLDPRRHECIWRGAEVQLTVTEFLLLQALVKHIGHVKSRDQLMDAAYGDNIYVDDRTIDSHIKRLRRKFKAADDDFTGIETLYGLGYRFQE
jgi:two-component system response regulator ChvI